MTQLSDVVSYSQCHIMLITQIWRGPEKIRKILNKGIKKLIFVKENLKNLNQNRGAKNIFKWKNILIILKYNQIFKGENIE